MEDETSTTVKSPGPRGRNSRIHAAVQSVSNVLKRHGNWSKSLEALKGLNDRLLENPELSGVDCAGLFEPFLNVVRSKKSTWLHTKVSLVAMDSMIRDGFLDPEAEKCSEAVNSIVGEVIKSKFAEVNRPEVEEAVELNILKVLMACVKCEASIFLPDEQVLKVLEKFIQMATQPRKTDIFQDVAEGLLTNLVYIICGSTLEECAKGSSNPPRLSLTWKTLYHVMSLIKDGVQETDQGALLSIGIIDDIVMNYGDSLLHFPLILLDSLKDVYCRKLLGCLRTQNVFLLTRCLRAFFNLYLFLKSRLKLQLEIFFTTLITHVLDTKKSPATNQEVALEVTVELCSQPTFITELYVNYDCDLYCANVFDTLCRYLYKNAFPVSGSLNRRHLLSLEGLQAIMRIIANSCATYTSSLSGIPPPPSASPINVPPAPSKLTNVKESQHLLHYTITADTPPATLREIKRIKEILNTGIDRFNIKPSDGLKHLQESGLLPEPLDAKAVSQFLRETPGLEKTTMGNYLGDRNPFNVDVLLAYIEEFVKEHYTEDTSPLVSTVRAFLESFRLPGEAPVISRIFENFGALYYKLSPATNTVETFQNGDAIYVMCYSLLMLNTDLHNRAIKKKMTQDEFVMRTSDLDDTRNLPKEFFDNVYCSIRDKEIKLPAEHPEEGITDNMWQSLLRRSRKVEFVSVTQNLMPYCNRDIFSIIWGPLIAALSVVFDTTFDNVILMKTLDGFHTCALISAHYNLNEVFDNLVISICKFSTLAQLASEHTTRIADFGVNKKAQLATKMLFDVIKKYSSHLREGWKNIIDCIFILHSLNLLSSLIDIPNFLHFEGADPTPLEKSESLYSNPLGFILDYSKWFSSPEKPMPEESEAEQKAKEVISQCGIREVIEGTKQLDSDSLIYLLKAIVLASSKAVEKSHTAFYLDLLTKIVLLNEERVGFIWALINDYYANLLPTATPTVLEKAVANFFLLSHALLDKPSISDQVFKSMEVIAKLKEVKPELESQIAFGILKIVQKHAGNLKSIPGWTTLFSMLEHSKNPTASSFRLEVISTLLPPKSGTTSYITQDTFTMCVNCLVSCVRDGKPQMAADALNLISTLFSLVPTIYGVHSEEDHNAVNLVWDECWKPILLILCFYWKDKRISIRDSAVRGLKTGLADAGLNALGPSHWNSFFQEVMFPLLMDLVKANLPTNMKPEQVEQFRLAASQVQCRAFLQHLQKIQLLPETDFRTLWMKMLEILCQLIGSIEKDNMKEELKEVLKNALLVMSVSGVYRTESETGDKINVEFWDATWSFISKSCPEIKEEIMGPDSSKVEQAVPSAVVAPPSPTAVSASVPMPDSPSSAVLNLPSISAPVELFIPAARTSSPSPTGSPQVSRADTMAV